MELDLSFRGCGDEYCNCHMGIEFTTACPACGRDEMLIENGDYDWQRDDFSLRMNAGLKPDIECPCCHTRWICDEPSGYSGDWDWRQITPEVGDDE